MSSPYTSPFVAKLASRWWVLVVRGVAAILFGIVALAWPEITLVTLILFWGAYALVDGVLGLVLTVRAGRAGEEWAWLLLSAIVSIAAGVLTFAWPDITALVLLAVIAVWALLTGVAEIAAAIRLRRVIRGEWLLATSGVLSVIFGVVLLAFPRSGALALVWLIGAYAIVFGLLLIGLGWRLKRWVPGGGRPMPAGDEPASR